MKLKKTSKEKRSRIDAKYVHITLHKLKNQDINYWVGKGMTFRENTVACLVGMEENLKEDKGLHAHIVIQFSTKQDLSRKQFVAHFGTDSLHIATKPNKEALLNALGYASKTGVTAQEGAFTYRGVELDSDPEVYRFQHQVKTKLDAIKYFQKVIDENLFKNKNIIKEYAKRRDAIGQYLVANPTVTKSLHKLAYTWYLDAQNKRKTGFGFEEWVDDPKEMRSAYKDYIKGFPEVFKKHLPMDSDLTLEYDYDKHEKHDLEVLRRLISALRMAIKYGSYRPHKSLNIFIWSKAPSFGKTRFLEFLDVNLMAYRLPDDQYYVDYESGMYQVLVSDEATAFLRSKSYSHLKLILEGKRVEFNLKGREKVIKEDNPLIVLADNVSFKGLMGKYFSDSYDSGVMGTRVIDLELRSRVSLHFLIDVCIKLDKKLHPIEKHLLL